MEDVVKFLKDCGVYYLATVEGDQPRVRPFGTAEIFENRLYILTRKNKKVSQQIQINNKVELCAFKDGKWLRVSAKLVRDDRIEAKRDMLDKNPDLRKAYDENDDYTEVLYLIDAVATFSSFTEPNKIIEF